MERQISACRMRAVRLSALLLASLFSFSLLTPPAAFALSELKQIPGEVSQDQKAKDVPAEEKPAEKVPMQIPMPDPLVNKPARTVKDDTVDDQPPAGPVEVLSDVSKIPPAVARMRELIVEAAASGDIERLRPLLGKGPTQTQVGEIDADPIETLKGLSGDPQGIEILAILLDVLSTGFVLTEKGTPDEAYVWPYFTEKPLASLTPPEKVDLFRLVTAGDFAEMEEGGNYNFYRVGITPDGQWKFFVAGD
ncbi:hypothetical protein [Rhizobium sp. Root483D2]|uniref:hypothetical protein n=1 Tax=Rhizobium sp. Root483D2 TaxID=1736545 RepID=UPI0007148067|nr:hypothetical protein [Rhizobium sp. Root483D2]KQY19381.1 hypothetical protein ASD32_08610 [Rhizobium sp. Root483D2]